MRHVCNFITIILFCFINPVLAAKPMQQFFYLHGQFSEVKVEIRVNDIPVLVDGTEDMSSVSMPINDALVSGQNTVDVMLTPSGANAKFTSACSMSLEIIRSASMTRSAERHAIGSLDIEDCSDTKALSQRYPGVTQSNNRMTYSIKIDAGDIFPRWAWQDGLDIKQDQAEFDSLLKAYSDIHALFQAKDAKALEQRLSLKTDEFKQCFFAESIDAAKKRVLYTELLQDKSAKLQPLWKKNMQLQLFAHGKLARIADPDGDSPIIFLTGESGNTAYVVKLIFMKNQHGDWVVVR